MNNDLISRQAVIDIIHLFFTEEVDKIPTKKTEDGEVYIIRKCQPLFEMNKAICKRIKALPSASPTQNCVENALGALDCISRQAVLNALYALCDTGETLIENPWRDNPHIDALVDTIEQLPSVNPQELYDFAKWVAREIFDEMWEYNKNAFAEIACRKLAKLGIVRAKGDEWELVEPQESEDA